MTTDKRSASYWERSEDPNHPDNGPSPSDWEDMGCCGTCRALSADCECEE